MGKINNQSKYTKKIKKKNRKGKNPKLSKKNRKVKHEKIDKINGGGCGCGSSLTKSSDMTKEQINSSYNLNKSNYFSNYMKNLNEELNIKLSNTSKINQSGGKYNNPTFKSALDVLNHIQNGGQKSKKSKQSKKKIKRKSKNKIKRKSKK